MSQHRDLGETGLSAPSLICVCSTLPPSNCRASLNATNRRHENIKKRSYEQRVQEVEHSYFTALVFSVSGGMAPAATTTFKS